MDQLISMSSLPRTIMKEWVKCQQLVFFQSSCSWLLFRSWTWCSQLLWIVRLSWKWRTSKNITISSIPMPTCSGTNTNRSTKHSSPGESRYMGIQMIKYSSLCAVSSVPSIMWEGLILPNMPFDFAPWFPFNRKLLTNRHLTKDSITWLSVCRALLMTIAICYVHYCWDSDLKLMFALGSVTEVNILGWSAKTQKIHPSHFGNAQRAPNTISTPLKSMISTRQSTQCTTTTNSTQIYNWTTVSPEPSTNLKITHCGRA